MKTRRWNRTVAVQSIRDRANNIIGYKYACISCGSNKSYLYTMSYRQEPYEMAVSEGRRHECPTE